MKTRIDAATDEDWATDDGDPADGMVSSARPVLPVELEGPGSDGAGPAAGSGLWAMRLAGRCGGAAGACAAGSVIGGSTAGSTVDDEAPEPMLPVELEGAGSDGVGPSRAGPWAMRLAGRCGSAAGACAAGSAIGGSTVGSTVDEEAPEPMLPVRAEGPGSGGAGRSVSGAWAMRFAGGRGSAAGVRAAGSVVGGCEAGSTVDDGAPDAGASGGGSSGHPSQPESDMMNAWNKPATKASGTIT
jgi:hypothetical protein